MEIMIAFAVLALALSTVIFVVFGNQSTGLSSETSARAFYKVQKLVEDARASRSHQNFLDIVSVPPASDSYDIFRWETKVLDRTRCEKKVTGLVTWILEQRPQYASISTLLTDPEEAISVSNECNVTSPSGDDWRRPKKLDVNGISIEGSGRALDVKNKIIYLVTAAAGNGKDDFFIIDATDKFNPIQKGSLDISDGLEDIDVAGHYAFIANDENKDKYQLEVIDISNLDNPSVIASASLPGASGSCPNTCPGGRSIYWYKNRVYMGTHRMTAAGAPEFNIFDVSNPANPQFLGSKGGAFLGDVTDHNINDIVVREQTIGGIARTYAYLATSGDSKEFIILNVTNPLAIPDPAGTLSAGSTLNLGNASANDLDATSLFIIGSKAYIGRERATGNNKDFYVVDISNPGAPTVIGSLKLNLNSNGSEPVAVQSIRVSASLAFIGTSDPNDPFQILDISNPSNIIRWEFSGCEINFSTFITDLKMEGSLIYTSMDAKGHNPKIIEPVGGIGGLCH